jgi:methionyl-tRNA formyltransferase
VRAVAPPFPGAFTEAGGQRIEIWETRIDATPARHPERAPCLYADAGRWYADCPDGTRLEIVRLAIGESLIKPSHAPPVLSNQPLALS